MGGRWTYETDDREPGAGMGEQDQAFFDDLTARARRRVVRPRGCPTSSGAWAGRTRSTARSYVADPPGRRAARRPCRLHASSAASKKQSRPPRLGARRQGGGGQRRRRRDPSGPCEPDLVDELAIWVAPSLLGAGKRLFDGFDRDLDLRIVKVYPGACAVHTSYDVVR